MATTVPLRKEAIYEGEDISRSQIFSYFNHERKGEGKSAANN